MNCFSIPVDRLLFVFDGHQIRLVGTVLLGEHVLCKGAHATKHLLRHLLVTLELRFMLVGDVKRFGGQLTEDIPVLAAHRVARDIFVKHSAASGYVMRDIGGFFNVQAINDDHVRDDCSRLTFFLEAIPAPLRLCAWKQ